MLSDAFQHKKLKIVKANNISKELHHLSLYLVLAKYMYEKISTEYLSLS